MSASESPILDCLALAFFAVFCCIFPYSSLVLRDKGLANNTLACAPLWKRGDIFYQKEAGDSEFKWKKNDGVDASFRQSMASWVPRHSFHRSAVIDIGLALKGLNKSERTL
jgi:hypothetical protein